MYSHHSGKMLRTGQGVLCLIVILQCSEIFGSSPGLISVNDDNWQDILEGEWMVEFFAPWCPACRSLQPVWEDFATWSNDLGIKVGQVDITTSPGLSGRFMITALPTIFHVKDGLFRHYKGSRSKEEFLGFVEEKRWEGIEPVSSWQSPSSIQMTLVSQFYKISMSLRNVMTVMLDEYGIPSWAAYLIFGVATILIGLILGLMLVCIIDFIYPPGHNRPTAVEGAAVVSGKEKDSDDEFTEEIQDEDSQEDEGEEVLTDSNENGELKEQDEVEKSTKSEESVPSASPRASTATRRRRRE